MIILGIDPGTRITGYGVIQAERNQFRHLDNGCIVPRASDEMVTRLTFISRRIDELLAKFQPDALSLEKAFFAKNAASALKLGQCRGAIMITAGRSALPLAEYSPNEIKQAVTGSGRAQKEQVQKMICMILGLREPPQADAADALAVAICHAQSYGLNQRRTLAANLGGRS